MTRTILNSRRLLLVCLLPWLSDQASAAFTSKLENSTLTLTQSLNDGPVVIDNNGAGGAFRVIEGGVTNFPAANSLVVKLLDSSDQSLIIDLDKAVARDLTLKLGSGPRLVDFSGLNNTIDGHLTIKAGDGDQTIELAVNAALVVSGSMTVNLGQGSDSVDEDGRDWTVTGSLLFKGVNLFVNNGNLFVAGDVEVLTSSENLDSTFDNDGTMLILGCFKYVGGNMLDKLFLDDGVAVGCDLDVNLGRGSTGGLDSQGFSLANGSSVGGNLTVRSGDSTNGATLATDATTRIGGKVKLSCGRGINFVSLGGRCGGSSIKYAGGKDVDIVIIELLARGAKVKVNLGRGADTCTLDVNTTVRSVALDFGAGLDTFNDGFSGPPAPFKVKLKNLP